MSKNCRAVQQDQGERNSRDCFKVFLLLAAAWALTFSVGNPLHAAAGPVEALIHVMLLTPLWLGVWVWLGGRYRNPFGLTAGAVLVTILWTSSTATLNRLPNPSFVRGFFPFSGKILTIVGTLACIFWVKRGTWRDYGFSWRLRSGTVRRTGIILVSFVGFEAVLVLGLLFTGVVERSTYVSSSAVSKMPLWEAAVFQFLLVGIAEELAFRSFLQSYLDRLLPGKRRLWDVDLGWGFLITLLVFSLCHVLEARSDPFLIVTNPVWLVELPFAFALGFLRSYTGAIWPSIVLHGLWNGLGDVLFPELVRHGFF